MDTLGRLSACVNVSSTAQTAPAITLQNFVPGASAQVYRMTNGGAPASDSVLAVSHGSSPGVSLPANSVVLLVVSK